MLDNMKIFSLMGKMPVEGLPQYQFSFLTQSREPFTPCLGRDGPQQVTDGNARLTISATGTI